MTTATITTNKGAIKLELFTEQAPETTGNFIKLANDGQDTRAIQHYLGHRNIQHTVAYTQLAPQRFNDFWGD